MSFCAIKLSHGRNTFAPAEKLTGSVEWNLNKLPESAEVRLFWYTTGKGDQDVSIVEKRTLIPSMQYQGEFEFVVPEGPFSFSGKLISLVWAIELVCAGADAVARETIVVSPAGKDIQLTKVQ